MSLEPPHSSQVFAGFYEPTENYYRLPNNWFDVIRLLRNVYGERCISLLKLLEYILRHTWGYGRFEGKVSLTARDIRLGRVVNGRHVDNGTGLSENSISKAAQVLQELGLIEVVFNEADKARRVRTFRPRINSQETATFTEETPFAGFDLPVENYFKVPVIWINLTRDTGSAACILAIEYLIRHSWGYHNPNGIWMDVNQVAEGRLYADNQRRYDAGIGFDRSTTYRALNEGVERGCLVWAERWEGHTPIRVFNLRLKGMVVDAQGKFLGQLPWEKDLPPEIAAIPCRTNEDGCRTIEAACRTDEAVSRIDEVVSGAIEADSRRIVEEPSRTNEAARRTDEDISRIDEDISRIDEARTETGHTLKDTLKTHLNQTPSSTPSDANRKILEQAVGDGDDDDGVEKGSTLLPVVIQEKLAALEWSDTGREVLEAYCRMPDLVNSWLDYALSAKYVKTSRAALFRSGLRSGLQPPYKPSFPASSPPAMSATADEDDEEDVETAAPAIWPPVDAPIQRIWDRALDQLQIDMPKSTFDTWVRKATPVSYDTDIFTIGAPNEYARDWLDGRLRSTVRRLLVGIVNRNVDVQFIAPGKGLAA